MNCATCPRRHTAACEDCDEGRDPSACCGKRLRGGPCADCPERPLQGSRVSSHAPGGDKPPATPPGPGKGHVSPSEVAAAVASQRQASGLTGRVVFALDGTATRMVVLPAEDAP